MAKVLLIQPHPDRREGKVITKPSTPIGLVQVGTAIEDKHPVKIYDRNFSLDDAELLSLIKEYKPDIMGYNSITSEMLFDLMHVAKLVKKEFPKVLNVVGGVHATIDPDSLLNEPYIDYIIRGEGEIAFLDFCDTFDKDKKRLKKLPNVNHNPLRPYANMDDLKFPNYNLLDLKKYGMFYINLSRGCPGTCSFCYSCKMWGKDGKPFIRAYSIEKAKELFKDLIEKYQIKVFSIPDDNFIPMKSRAIELCNFLSNYNLSFFCFGRADYLEDNILQALKRAGCHIIQIGIESGSQRILDFLNKQTTVQQNIEAIKAMKRNKISLDASCMIGITTETPEDLKQTVNLIKKYKPDIVNVWFFNPMPGTPIFDYCVSKNLIKEPKTLEEWANWSGKFNTIRHNTSEIPDKMLTDAFNDLLMTGFYKNKFKRLLYWIKKREFKYILKSSKRMLFVKEKLHIPLIGFVNKN